jgi:REP element-mobilizing transposase RayT
MRLLAYCLMPTHMHAIFFDAKFDNERLQRSLADFRKFTGRSLSDYCACHLPKCFLETLRASSTADRERRFWQPSRHPEAIHSEKFWRQKLDYLHKNPVRKGLGTRAWYWRFSSAAQYVSDGRESCDVRIGALDWM